MDFRRSYELLGLQPGNTWDDLQVAYRRQVQKWHPDRFEQQPELKPEAAHRMQALNEAFGLLEQYYREQGRLPLEPPRHTARATPQPRPPPQHKATAPPPQSRRRRREPSTVPRMGPWIIVAALLGFGVYYLLDWVMSSYHQTINVDRSRIQLPADLPVEPAQPPAGWSKSAASRKPPMVTFGYGDPPGRVLEVQGIPTRTSGDLWFYGDSEVYFEKGRVVSWRSSPTTPLNVAGASKAKPTGKPPR